VFKDIKDTPSLDVNYCRAQFPAKCWDWAFFENAGGSFVPKSVIERMTAYMSECQVQPGAPFPASELAAERMADGHRKMAEIIGAEPEEVVIGPSTSANIDVLARSLRPTWRDGDEVIVTNLNHEANSGPWRRLAVSGIRIVEWPVNPDTAQLDLDLLDRLLTDRTRLVALPHVSNITGDINDIEAVTATAHAAGAMVCVDGVALAPHRAIDVKALGVDFYAFSFYKIYGPHIGCLYGKKERLLEARGQHHYFIGEDAIPYKMNPAGPQHEMIASLVGIADYIDALAKHHLDEPPNSLTGRARAVFQMFAMHEEKLAKPFVEFLGSKPQVRLIGSRDWAAPARAPTFSLHVPGRSSEQIARAIGEDRVAVRHGDFYARRSVEAVGIEDADDGVVRCSMAHYNTAAEVGRLIEALDRVL